MLKAVIGIGCSMYGMVNRAIEDLIVSSAGNETWKKIKLIAGLDIVEFDDTENYQDDVTFLLVRAASEVLGESEETILELFGRHWVLYTGRNGWSDIMDLTGSSFLQFIESLDVMHSRIQFTMPEMRMPLFKLVRDNNQILLEYRSEREGLAPMVVGMLYGLAEHFDEQWQVKHIKLRKHEGYDLFQLEEK